MPLCPACHADYAPGATRCHDCDLDLVESLEGPGPGAAGAVPALLVTVATFGTPIQASLLASRLEAEGIECFIADGELVGMYSLLSGAVGGVKVQVREADVPRASYLVRETPRQAVPAAPPRAPECPACGRRAASREGLSILQAFLVVFSLGALSLLFTPRWRCRSCSHTWR